VALLGVFGAGNFGNDATLEAILEEAGRRMPWPDIVCICAAPDQVAASWGLATVPHHPGAGSRLVSSRWRVARLLGQVERHVGHWIVAYRTLRRVDVLIVAGTGVLDDQHVRPQDLPYPVFVWSIAARVARTRLAMLSVGAGPITNRLSRRLLLASARSASLVSYRDPDSLAFMRSIGRHVTSDRVTADLAFSLRPPASSPPRRRAIAVGVISSYHWHGVEGGYGRYLDRLAEVVSRVLAEGIEVDVVVGDVVDRHAVTDLATTVRARVGDAAIGLAAPTVNSFGDVLDVMDRCRVMVASRYHNLVAALLRERPAISLEYGPKNSALLHDVGLGHFCHEVESFEPDAVVDQVLKAMDGDLQPQLHDAVTRFRTTLDEQYDRLLGPPATAARREEADTVRTATSSEPGPIISSDR
jgi:polysaccharide pyruvyl transferase WcaK-like protein